MNSLPNQAAADTAGRSCPLLMVAETHFDELVMRHVGRPALPTAEQRAQARESVARLPNATKTGGYGYVVSPAGIAVVQIRGTITPEAYAWYDDQETIAEWVIRDLTAMQNDPAVKGVAFVISSPGGYVAGSFELAGAIALLAAAKPTTTFASGYCCSAAYLQASQTGAIHAFSTTIVGSIGTRSAVIDASGYFQRLGIKVIPIDSGGMKSAGLLGTEITQEQIDYFRTTVLQLQEQFTAAVARGRNMKPNVAQALADGRVHVAPAAKALNLIDHVSASVDQAIQSMGGSGTNVPKARVDDRPAAQRAQDFQEMIDCRMNSTGCTQAEAIVEAGSARQDLYDGWREVNSGKSKPGQQATTKKAGTNVGRQTLSQAQQAFDEAVTAEMQHGRFGNDRKAAKAHVLQTRPDLRKAMLLAANPNKSEEWAEQYVAGKIR